MLATDGIFAGAFFELKHRAELTKTSILVSGLRVTEIKIQNCEFFKKKLRTFKEIFENLIDLNVDYVFHETTSWNGRKSVFNTKAPSVRGRGYDYVFFKN